MATCGNGTMMIPTTAKTLVWALTAAFLAIGVATVARASPDGDAPDVEVRPLAEARFRLEQARADLAVIDARIEALRARAEELVGERARLDAEQQRLLEAIEQARSDARDLAVDAFVSGNGTAQIEYVLDSDTAGELSWRSFLVNDHVDATTQAALAYRQLHEQATRRVGGILAESDANAADLVDAGAAREQAVAAIAHADTELVVAEAWDRAEAAMAGTGRRASEAAWDRLVQCESRGDYRVVSAGGTYRGAYQFDRQTWRAVGGTGDPAAAEPLEQDARARILYAERGRAPWPVCGRHLSD